MATNYDREEALGEGTYGKVYKATDRTTKRPVAIKVIKNDVYGVNMSSLREVRYLKAMKHPNIIEVT